MKSQTHKQLKPLIIAALLSCSIYAGTAAAQVPTGDYSHIGLQVAQWAKNLEQWNSQFEHWKAGTIDKLAKSMGIKTGGYSANNKAAYAQYIKEFKDDQRCNRMSSSQQAMARSICTARRSLEVADLEAFLDVMDYTDQMQADINDAVKEAMAIDSSKHPEEAKQKLAQVQAMQTEMQNTIKSKTDSIQTNGKQIAILKEQQANLARIAFSGKVPSAATAVADGLLQGLILKGAFTVD